MTSAILILGLCAYLWLTIAKPKIALGILLALAPAYLIRFEFGIPTTLLEMVLVVFLLGTLLTKWRDIKILGQYDYLNLSIGLFLVAGIISVVVSPETNRALGIFKSFILEPVLLFYAVLLTVRTWEDFIIPLRWLFSSATIISLFGVFQYFTLFYLPFRFWGNGEEVRRITSIFEYPNALALYLTPLFTLFLVLGLKKYNFLSQGWWITGLVLQAVALIFTFSRGAWLGVAAVLLLFILQSASLKKIIPVFLLIAALCFLFTPIRDRIIVTVNDPSGVARLDLASAGVEKIKTNPIFGNGLYGFRTTLAEQNFEGEILNYPHNIVLNFWLEMGALGLLSFASIVILSLLTLRQNKNALTIGAACFMGVVLIHGLVDVPYFKNDLAVLTWFALSMFWTQK